MSAEASWASRLSRSRRRARCRRVFTVSGLMARLAAVSAAPADLRVGDTVEWINADNFQHSATARNGGFDADLPPKAHVRTVLSRSHRGLLPLSSRHGAHFGGPVKLYRQ